MTIEQLQERAKAYFKSGVKEIFVTEDGNFFYKEAESYAVAHSKQNNTRLHLLKSQSPVSEKVKKTINEDAGKSEQKKKSVNQKK